MNLKRLDKNIKIKKTLLFENKNIFKQKCLVKDRLKKHWFFKKTSDFKCKHIDFIIGDCGSGKTTFAVSQCQKYLKKGYPVYSNVPILGCRKLVIDDLMVHDLEENAVIIFDEAATYGLASRGTSYKDSNKPSVIEFFTMYRHYKIKHIFIISPSFQDVIPVVRSRVNKVTVVKKPFFISLFLLPFNLIRIIFKLEPINIGLVKYIKKKLIVPKLKDTVNEPSETFISIPITRKYFIQNKYYKFFDSYSKKDLQFKDWDIY